MNEFIRRYINIYVLFSLLVPVQASASYQTFDQYRIESAWFDQTHIYIVFQKKRVSVSFSKTNIEGTPKDVTSERYIATLDRASSIGRADINLASRKSASSIVYKDEDVQVTTNGDQTTVEGANGAWRRLLKYSERVAPIRYKNLLLVTGTLINVPTGEEISIPGEFTSLRESNCASNASTGVIAIPAVPVFAVGSDSILATCSPAWQSIQTLDLVSWTRKPDSEVRRVTLPLPPVTSGYVVLNSSIAYSPSRVALRSLQGNDIVACSITDCKYFPFEKAFTYAILDADSDSAIILIQPNLTSSRVLIRLVKAR